MICDSTRIRLHSRPWHIAEVARSEVRRAAGTYGALQMLRHPSRMFWTAPPSDSQSDIEAVQTGKARTMTCFLRGSSDPYPINLKQGTLLLAGDRATWKPYWHFRRRPLLRINTGFDTVTTRAADRRESEVVKTGGGGRALGVILVPTFIVVTCANPALSVDFVVSSSDGPLVVHFFKTMAS
jgi:hypothetical protein